jgi:ABC-type multidrug transport system fused ATPase/permease subunit
VSTTPDLSQARYTTLLLLLWGHVQPRRRVQLALLILLMLLSSFAELLTIASLVPFLAILSDPAGLWRQPWVRGAAQAMGFSSAQQLILPITLCLMAAGLVSATIRVANLFVNARLSALICSDLSVEAYRRTLDQPYAVHLGRNSSDVITRLAYLGGISRGVLAPLLQGLSGLIVAVVLVAGLVLYQPTLAAGLAAVFLLTYGSLARLNRRRLRRISVDSDRYSKRLLKVQQEGLGAIRDVLLDGSQAIFVDLFRQAQRPLLLLQAEAETVAGLPRFALEAVAIVAIIGSVLWLLPRGGALVALPAIGALAFGFQRLLPAVQQMYAASTYLGAYRDVLAGGLELLEQPLAGRRPPQAAVLAPPPETLPFQRELEFRGVEFSHRAGIPVLRGIDLSIRPGEWIGLVGATGSGKSTLLDLLMGLLSPSRGDILVDGLPLVDRAASIDRRRAWQRHLAHVPQSIFLADASIAENIAFGVVPERIDRERLAWAAASAQAAEFIAKMPQSFDTLVGERGVRLSGGQRQRLGIARALYKQADVLVLDEATSALDNLTEQAVIESLARLGQGLTVVMVAHRLSTVAHCDKIIELDGGVVRAIGSYGELLDTSPGFRTLAQVSQASGTFPVDEGSE